MGTLRLVAHLRVMARCDDVMNAMLRHVEGRRDMALLQQRTDRRRAMSRGGLVVLHAVGRTGRHLLDAVLGDLLGIGATLLGARAGREREQHDARHRHRHDSERSHREASIPGERGSRAGETPAGEPRGFRCLARRQQAYGPPWPGIPAVYGST